MPSLSITRCERTWRASVDAQTRDNPNASMSHAMAAFVASVANPSLLYAVTPRIDWARLLRRSMDVDALKCPKCD
jgi:hypothetical protein